MARFAIVAFLLLLAPYIARHRRIPSVVGKMLAGLIVGPHGLGVMPKNACVADFFAEPGKLGGTDEASFTLMLAIVALGASFADAAA